MVKDIEIENIERWLDEMGRDDEKRPKRSPNIPQGSIQVGMCKR